MKLRETISSMRNKYSKDIDFYAAISTMKRKADKGLLEGISSDDIDQVIDEINNSNSNFYELDSLIYETEAAVNTYNKILDENISDEELSTDLLSYYLTEGNLMQKIKNKQEEDNEDRYQYNDYKKKTTK